MNSLKSFYKGKKILVTGHNGFKGTWLTQWLVQMGSQIVGISLENKLPKSLFEILDLNEMVKEYFIDIRDLDGLLEIFEIEKPEIVIHLAAQPIVIDSYENPVYTHAVNYGGTLNVLESIRKSESVKTSLIITSDKVYAPSQDFRPLIESDKIGGLDPYSASKSAVEILVDSYRSSFFDKQNKKIATVRAGNVIGFGDWGKYRLFPDILRAIITNKTLHVRNPDSIRPWQYVNDVIYQYLNVIVLINSNESSHLFNSFNIGPLINNITVNDILAIFNKRFSSLQVEFIEGDVKETKLLILDSSKINNYIKHISSNEIDDAVFEIISQFDDFENFRYERLKSRIIESIEYLLKNNEN